MHRSCALAHTQEQKPKRGRKEGQEAKRSGKKERNSAKPCVRVCAQALALQGDVEARVSAAERRVEEATARHAAEARTLTHARSHAARSHARARLIAAGGSAEALGSGGWQEALGATAERAERGGGEIGGEG